jgi:hypothetical protein
MVSIRSGELRCDDVRDDAVDDAESDKGYPVTYTDVDHVHERYGKTDNDADYCSSQHGMQWDGIAEADKQTNQYAIIHDHGQTVRS